VLGAEAVTLGKLHEGEGGQAQGGHDTTSGFSRHSEGPLVVVKGSALECNMLRLFKKSQPGRRVWASIRSLLVLDHNIGLTNAYHTERISGDRRCFLGCARTHGVYKVHPAKRLSPFGVL
jgi:hypothetical protein